MKLYRLTITSVSDRNGLANSLRDLYYTLSISKRFKIADNLPFVDEEMCTEVSHIDKVLSPYCKYSYEQIPFPGNTNTCTPPWESVEYIRARNWYKTLPEEDKNKIDILVKANMPWG